MDSDSEDNENQRPCLQLPEKTTCIICGCKSKLSELSHLKDADSWHTLLNAAKIKNFLPIVNLSSSETSIPDLVYHRTCRSKFTHKKTLLQMGLDNQENTNQDGIHPQKQQRQLSADTSRVYDKICIFCDKKTKYFRCSRSREPLTQASELRTDDKVRNVANLKMDSKILAITSRELVAAEAHYHRTCYRDYTRSYYDVSSSGTKSLDPTPDEYRDAENDAYQMLFAFIRNFLFETKHVISMVELTDKLVAYMTEQGVQEILPKTKKHIRRKLETEFGDSLIIFQNMQGKLLVIPDNMSVKELAAENMELKNELRLLTEKRSVPLKEVEKAAMIVRKEIKSNQAEMNQKWPPHPSDLDPEKENVPESLTTFLNILLTGDKVKNLSSKSHRLIQSISHDVMYNVSGGTFYTPKHVLLPWVVKTLTGNVEMIRILNRLGHGISYSKLEEIETALCLQKLAVEETVGISIPTDIFPGVQTTLAFDNIDRLEETLSGGGTSHRVNGIAVQAQSLLVELPKQDVQIPKEKRRSIPPTSNLLPPYNAGNREGPPTMKPTIVDSQSAMKEALCKNWIWSLARQANCDQQTVSSWTGFNILTRDQIPVTKDVIGYLPTINAPATELSTVNEILSQAHKIKNVLQLEKIVCVLDQALYAKAVEIIWKQPHLHKSIVLRMGVFHTICNLLGILGKRFQDAGLRDLAVESGVISEGSVDRVMDGRHYNRGVRLHKLVYEALLRLAWKSFDNWCNLNQVPFSTAADDIKQLIGQLHQTTTQASLMNLLENPQIERMLHLFEIYLQSLRSSTGELAEFWMSYVDMVEILLGLIRSSREGNWPLHLHCIRELLPWCFAYDKVNYSRYLSVYYTEMTSLQDKHPEIFAYFVNGGFSVQRGEKNPFGRIPVDQTIEETINKDTQTAGGTKGFSLKPSAVSRYYLTAEHRSICLNQLRRLTEIQAPDLSHHDLEHSRMVKDETDVQSIVHLMENEWTNPFESCPSDLISLSTGTCAPTDVAKDLQRAKQLGEETYLKFSVDRLENQTQKFYDRLPKQNLKTFTNVKCQKKRKGSNNATILKADHRLFGHMLLVAQSRKLDMRKVLALPLGPLPWALANCDGTMKKTNKAALARHLEKSVSSPDVIPEPSTCIIDGMSLVQKTHGENKTFGELSQSLLTSALHIGTGSNRIDVVFDVYHNHSIKSAERVSRGSENSLVYSNIASGHKIRQWRRLLTSSKSKTNFIKFIAEDWQLPQSRSRLEDRILHVTCESKCYRITSESSDEVESLSSTQEEADTRMLLHAKHASLESASVVIASDDTDVLVLSLAKNSDIETNLYIKAGNKNRQRFIDVKKVAAAFGQGVCKALPGLHAYTGCDTVSSFGGRGKVNAFKLLVKSKAYQDAFQQLGNEWTMRPGLKDSLEAFTCCLYAQGCTVKKVNELRYHLFQMRKGAIESGQLPPCSDCLSMHLLRANYQAVIWNKCLEAEYPTPLPTNGHGWLEENGQIEICWMTGPLAPDAVLEFISCKCTRDCKLPSCQCLSNGLKCTVTCQSQTCSNMACEDLDMPESDSDDEDVETAAYDVEQ